MKNKIMKYVTLILSLLIITMTSVAASSNVWIDPEAPGVNDDLKCNVVGPGSSDPYYIWKKNGIEQGAHTGSTVDDSYTDAGEHWECIVQNPWAPGAPVELGRDTVIISGNSATVEITPQDANESDDLVCEVGGGYDPDGVYYIWKRDGIERSAFTSNTVPSTATNSGEIWECIVQNPWSPGGPAEIGRDSITVGTEGVQIDTTIIPLDPDTTDDLHCDASSGSGDYFYYWYRNGVEQVDLIDATVDSSLTTRGERWTCELQDIWSSVILGDYTVTIGNAEPSIEVPTISPTPAYTNTDLTCNKGLTDDADADTVTVSYSWYKNGAELSGETSSTLTSDNFVKGDELYCQTTPNDGIDDGVAQNSISTTIQNSAPIVTLPATLNMNEDNVTEFDFSSYAADPDGDAMTWSVTGENQLNVSISGDTITITPSADWFGQETLTFTATDVESATGSDSVVMDVANVNDAPVANFTYSPDSPVMVNEIVTFTDASYDIDSVSLSFSWDFGDESTSTSQNPTHAYDTPGDYTVTLTVSDGSLQDSMTQTVTVEGLLNVTSLSCFPRVIEGNDQRCAVEVMSNGAPVGDADVTVYYQNGTEFGSSKTDSITGVATVIAPVGAPGTYTVYSNAEKTGYEPDNDQDPTYTFEVWAHRYNITDLAVYNDAAFTTEDYDFFRGENMYVKFRIIDINNPGSYVTDPTLVKELNLTSAAGGNVGLSESQPQSAGWYYYELTPIPATHYFKGDSQVFTFVFNFATNEGGQEEVDITIRNVLPVITGLPAELNVSLNSTLTMSLTPYESDLEDSGEDLVWSVSGVDESVFTADVAADDTLTIIPVANGSDTITLTLTDLDNDNATQNVLVRIISGPSINHAPVANFTYSPANPEENETVSFTDASTDEDAGDVLSHNWDFGEGSTSTDQNPTHVYATAGNYTVVLTVSDGELQDSMTQIVEVTSVAPGNDPPVADFTFSPASPEVNESVSFTDASSDPNGDSLVYLWDFGEGSNSANQNVTFVYGVEGTYNVTLTVSDGEFQDSITKQITVSPITVVEHDPVAEFTWGPARPCEEAPVNFVDMSTDEDDDIVSWSWTFGNGESSNQQNPPTVYDDEGTYTVTLTVEDSTGRTDTISKEITVEDEDDESCKEIDEDENPWLKISSVSGFSGGNEFISAGNFMRVPVRIQNMGETVDFKDVHVSAMGLDGLYVRDSEVVRGLDGGSKDSVTLLLDIPEDTEAGEYWIRLSVHGDDFENRRIHRAIIIE